MMLHAVLVQLVLCSLTLALPATIITQRDLLPSYDYVIAGGCTSGLTVANRLTEDRNITLLVIEVGRHDEGEPGVLVPGIGAPQKYWRIYNSIPQVGLLNRTSKLYTGQVVGGGTVVNGMFFNRGSAKDYDAWEQLGNPGWGWKDLLPYFKKSENYTPATDQIQATFPVSPHLSPHGTNGPVGSSYPPFFFEISKNFFRAWQSLGVLLNAQSNAGRAVGAFFSPMSLTAWNMSRSSASSAYYKGEPSTRANFHLLTGHRVRKIVFENKRAYGVEYAAMNGTAIKIVKPRKETIIACGSQRSPQLLQLSGIGPRLLLSSLQIPIIENLPGVGRNFQDQPSYYFTLAYSNLTTPTPDWLAVDNADHADYAKAQLALYYRKRLGAYTLTYEGGSTVAFLPLKNITSAWKSIADGVLIATNTTDSTTSPTVLRGYGQQRQILSKHYTSSDTATQETAYNGSPTLIFVLLKPLSRGSILINSTSLDHDPVIDFGTFSHASDLDIMVEAFKKNRAFISSAPMQEVGASEVVPGLGVQTDDDIAFALRNGTLSSWQHPVGTLAMMPRELGGVVDPELRVYGVEGLRVVDASIMPIIPASHTSSTVYAVAEKAADLIKATRKESV